MRELKQIEKGAAVSNDVAPSRVRELKLSLDPALTYAQVAPSRVRELKHYVVNAPELKALVAPSRVRELKQQPRSIKA